MVFYYVMTINKVTLQIVLKLILTKTDTKLSVLLINLAMNRVRSDQATKAKLYDLKYVLTR